MSMRTRVPRPIQAGFTLVELLIVVIILTVLAAIIVPQFSSATLDAKEATLDSNLARMRSSIELYHAQHGSVYPGKAASSGAGAACAGTAGSGAADSAQALIDQMVMYSDASGRTCSLGDTTFKYGPYVRKGFPSDPISGKGSVAGEIDLKTAGAPIVPTAPTGGWAYDTKSGQLVLNSDADDSRGKKYYTH